MIIWLLINQEINAYDQIKEKIKPQDFKFSKNQKIAEILYEHFEKGNSNNNIINLFNDEEIVNHITSIMADDFEITNNEKATKDILTIYEKEKLLNEKNNIIKHLEDKGLDKQEASELEKRLSTIIIQLAKMK